MRHGFEGLKRRVGSAGRDFVLERVAVWEFEVIVVTLVQDREQLYVMVRSSWVNQHYRVMIGGEGAVKICWGNKVRRHVLRWHDFELERKVVEERDAWNAWNAG